MNINDLYNAFGAKNATEFYAALAAISSPTAPDAADVDVAAGTDGLAAGDVQAALQALATRIQALEDAAV